MAGASQNSYTLDANMRLEDGVTTFTTAGGGGIGQVGAADAILDFGSSAGVAFTPAAWVTDVDTIEFTTGDENYHIFYQLSNSATMASGVVSKAALHMGDAANNYADDTADGRVVVGVDNEYKGTVYRYGAIWVLAAGTTAVITVRSFLSR